MSGDRDLDRAAADYWMGLAKAGAQKPPPRPRRRKLPGGNMPEESEPENTASTDPLVLIVQALRENADAIQAMEAELRAVQLAMAEMERKMAQRADTNSADTRSLTLAFQQFTASQARIAKAESANYWWGAGAFVGGMVFLEGMTLLCRNFFG